MDDLFSVPSDDPYRIARALERHGELERLRMRKGKQFLTWEHRAAKIVRQYAAGGSAPNVAAQASKLISGLKSDLAVANTWLECLCPLVGIGWGLAVFFGLHFFGLI